MSTVAVALLAAVILALVICCIVLYRKVGSLPSELAAALSRAAVAERAAAEEKATLLAERGEYEAKLERARARRTECENAWVQTAAPAAVLDHLRNMDDELQPLHPRGDAGGSGPSGQADQVPLGTKAASSPIP